MLTITVPGRELWNEKEEKFYTLPEQTLQMEHSLISLSKWESKWHKPFLTDNKRVAEQKTPEMNIDYYRCMTINKNVDPLVYYHLTQENINEINEYISNPMTAATFREDPNKPHVNINGSFTTAETLYYQMAKLGINQEIWEKRHLNRLLALLRYSIIEEERANNPKKQSKAQTAAHYRALNAARRKAHR